MTTVLDASAPALYDEDGDFIGYDLPDADPVSIETKWLRRWGREDDLVYVVTWADGTHADMFSFSTPGWHDIYLRCIRERQAAGLAKLDAAMAKAAEPLDATLEGLAAA